MTVKEIGLRWPTHRTHEGPRFLSEIENSRGKLVVEYDYEDDNDQIHWTKIVFEMPLLVEYRSDIAPLDPDVIESDVIRCLDDSPLLLEIKKSWLLHVSEEWQEEYEAKMRHYTIYFDDGGCFTVVAFGYQVF